MLRRLAALFFCSIALLPAAAAAADDIVIVYLGTNDCPYCQHWEARAKAELLTSPEGRVARFYEVKGETLRQTIVERHYPEELKWLARRLGPLRGVPRFVLVVNGQVAWSVIGTNDYESVFLPALRQAVARRNDRA